MKSINKIVVVIITIVIVISTILPVNSEDMRTLKERFKSTLDDEIPLEYYNSMKYPYYYAILEQYKELQYKPAEVGSEIIIGAEEIRFPKECKNAEVKPGVGGSNEPSFIWNDDVPWIEWEFDIESEGLYEIELEFYMPDGSSNPSVRSLYIDDNIPFIEANNITFYRMWKDEGEPVLNSINDETRPKQVEVKEWRKTKLNDSKGFYSQPFKFFFTKGNHVVRLEYIEQPMVVGKIYIKPAEILPKYEDIKELYKSKGYTDATQTIEFQAESTCIAKSDPTIRRENDGDPICKPQSYINRKLNVIGSWRWRKGNQSITWKFSVPEDGLYKIAVRVAQWWNDGLPSFRQVAIDGKVPFQELEEYKFTYDRKWRTQVLNNDKDEPYLFFLTKGEHTITMTTKMGSLTEIILSLNDDTLLLSKIIRDITKITGSNPDPNYDYELIKTIPSLKGDMEALMESLQYKYDLLKSISNKLPAMANNFLTIKSQLSSMIKDPFSIARRMNDLNSALSSLGSWFLTLQEQPLLIDYFLVGPPEKEFGNPQSNVFQKIAATISSFLISFVKDYDNIGGILDEDTEVREVLNVWVSRGTEWAELIKEMADEEFTPKTGIMINMNILPASQLQAGGVNALMLSITSGKAPDVACGLASSSPVEFAIRDAVYDLSKFEDFDDVSKRFLPSIFIPYKYRGGVYALPETMNFTLMFYRKDILEELGIRLPDTREDLYNYTLPALYQNGLEFYYPADFTQFIFQHGGNFYTPDGRRSALDTPEAFRAFKECSELFTNYGIPVSASLFNRMRTGEMPIGIGNYSLYMQLSVAAPELAGRWGVAVLPGIRKDDGIVDRSFGGIAGECDIILNQSQKKEEAWEFLKWWSSTSVQTRFARELEALIGTEARWNTANYEAFTSLPWKKEDLEVIKEQLEWAKETPVVLGGYFTGRHLTNAWNRVIINGQNLRDALEEAVEDINRELLMKQEEYGVFDSQR